MQKKKSTIVVFFSTELLFAFCQYQWSCRAACLTETGLAAHGGLPRPGLLWTLWNQKVDQPHSHRLAGHNVKDFLKSGFALKKVLNVPLPKKVVIVRVYKIGIKKGIFTKIELLTKYISLWATHLLTATFITSTEYRTYVAEINCLIVFYLVYGFFF